MPLSADNFTAQNISNALNAVEAEVFEQPISLTELTDAVKAMKKGRSPGSNGYTAGFFKCFWKKLGPFLHRALVFCIQKRKTPLSHREDVITMIPKPGKPANSIKGWRPITLLNVDFKIISAAVSARMQSVMDKLIDKGQTAYIKGRFIGENTRLVYDAINYLIEKKGTGLIMSADFESAFDSLSWEFVSKALHKYGFGPKFPKK